MNLKTYIFLGKKGNEGEVNFSAWKNFYFAKKVEIQFFHLVETM